MTHYILVIAINQPLTAGPHRFHPSATERRGSWDYYCSGADVADPVYRRRPG